MKKKIKKIISKMRLYYYSFFYNSLLLKRNCKINGNCKFNGKEEFGMNVNFNGCKVYGSGKVFFGDNFHSAKGLKFLTSFHNYKGVKIPYDHTTVTRNINIEDNVWIGMDVLIMGGVTIGEGAIIQAGSVVVKDIPSLSIAGGHPAIVFSQRDKEHYFSLKSENKFL